MLHLALHTVNKGYSIGFPAVNADIRGHAKSVRVAKLLEPPNVIGLEHLPRACLVHWRRGLVVVTTPLRLLKWWMPKEITVSISEYYTCTLIFESMHSKDAYITAPNYKGCGLFKSMPFCASQALCVEQNGFSFVVVTAEGRNYNERKSIL